MGSSAEENEEANQLDVGKGFAGPKTKDRKCTDVLWLLLLLAHWASVTYVGFVGLGWARRGGMGKGRPIVLVKWIDHNGYVCDEDSRVAGKPLLYFPNPIGRSRGSPSGARYPVASGPNAGALASAAYGVCVEDCPGDGDTVTDGTVCDDDEGRASCDSWDAYDSVRFVNYCVPHVVGGLELEDDAVEESSNPVFRFLQEFLSDVVTARIPIAVAGLLLPFVAGFLYVALLRVPGVLCCMVWGSVALAFVALAALGAACWRNGERLRDVDDDAVRVDARAYERASTAAAVVFFALALLFLCAVCCMRRAIMLAMGLVKEAGVAVNRMRAVVLLPMVQAAAVVVFLLVLGVYAVHVATAGEKELVDKDSFGALDLPYHTYDVSNDQLYALWYLLFDAFWTLEFIAALGQLVIATAAATYYFTRDKRAVSSASVAFAARHSVLYHAGTAALGALLLGLVRWVRAVLLFVW